MSRRSFSVAIHESNDAHTILSEIQLAERLGYDAVWLGDSQLIWRELYVLLGAAAKTTSRILLGIGVTNPVTRHPSVTASAVATLQELSGGRVILGIGTGDSSVRTLGMKPTTLATLEEVVNQVRTLCSGGPAVTSHGEIRLTFGAPEKCPPVIIAASGPKALRLAGRIGDGVILSMGTGRTVIQKALGHLQEGFQARTRPKDGFRTIFPPSVAVHPDGRRARAGVRAHVARVLLLTFTGEMSEAAAAAEKKLRAAYNYYEHLSPTALHAELIPDEVITEFAIAGTPEECREQVTELFNQGVDELRVCPYGVDGAPRSTAIEAFARVVMDPLRRSASSFMDPPSGAYRSS